MRDLIIDNNVAGLVFHEPNDAMRPVHAALNEGHARAVHGGRLTDEYVRNDHVRRRLVLLDRRGAARRLPRPQVDARESELEASGQLTSDDPHVLAVAQVGNVRLLVSNDAALIQDFQNRALIDAPQGKVYCTLAKRGAPRVRPDIFEKLLR